MTLNDTAKHFASTRQIWRVNLVVVTVLAATAWHAAPTQAQDIRRNNANWKGADPAARQADARSAAGALAPVRTERRAVAQVTTKPPHLSTDAGQTWREYDIRPYTVRAGGDENPQQPIVDWILQETGHETWHSGAMGFFHADERTLTVFHTDDVQRQVAAVVDRFVNSEAESHVYGMRIVSLKNPNWRAKAQGMLQPVPIQTPGAQAWLMHKENMALLLSELRRRTDYREHSSSHLMAGNGRSTIVSTMRQRPYVRDILVRPGSYPGFEVASAHIEEGLEVDLTPLLSVDRQMIDAVIKCRIGQVEKVTGVTLEMPAGSAGTNRQKTRIEVPQDGAIRDAGALPLAEQSGARGGRGCRAGTDLSRQCLAVCVQFRSPRRRREPKWYCSWKARGSRATPARRVPPTPAPPRSIATATRLPRKGPKDGEEALRLAPSPRRSAAGPLD